MAISCRILSISQKIPPFQTALSSPIYATFSSQNHLPDWGVWKYFILFELLPECLSLLHQMPSPETDSQLSIFWLNFNDFIHCFLPCLFSSDTLLGLPLMSCTLTFAALLNLFYHPPVTFPLSLLLSWQGWTGFTPPKWITSLLP